MGVTIASRSEIGGRNENQDYQGYLVLEEACCLVVADGVGSFQTGNQAAMVAIESILSLARQQGISTKEEFAKQLIYEANSELVHCNQTRQQNPPMTTTITLVLANSEEMICAHTGDSRIYVFMEGVVVYQSTDHSLVQRMVQQGEITSEEAATHQKKNVILSALGADLAPAITTQTIPIGKHKSYGILLLSDGFWELITEEEMIETMKQAADATEWVTKMVRLVGNRLTQTSDNYTCLALLKTCIQ